MELNELCCSSQDLALHVFLPLIQLLKTFYEVNLFPVVRVFLQYFGEREGMKKKCEKKLFHAALNIEEKFKSGIGKIYEFVTFITISAKEGDGRVKFALLHSNAQTTGWGNTAERINLRRDPKPTQIWSP